jgi:predicted ATP-grasp superfamily ATP-dependent carboligase
MARSGALYDLPVFLEFPDKAKAEGPHRRVVVYGAFFSDWNAALIDRAMWQAIPGVVEVMRLIHTSQVAGLGHFQGDTLIVPLGEEHIRQCPAGYLSLVPDLHTLDVLADKARFAEFMEETGLAALCPQTYRHREDVEFPCLLKRVDQNGAYGIELVSSADQLDVLLNSKLFAGQKHVLQAFVPGQTEYATHCVCRDGEILWSCSFSRAMGPVPRIGGLDHDSVVPVTLPPQVRAQIADVLARLHFSGPCCVDHKIRESGDVAIFEINPRFGGSLMTSANRAFLGQALACIVANAR